MTEQEALVVLNAVPSLGAVRIRKLRGYFGSGRQILASSLEELYGCSVILPEIAENIFYFSKDKFLKAEYNLLQRRGITVITAADEGFPCSLQSFDDAPVVLYVKGSVRSLENDSIAIVGSRAASFYGTKSAKTFAQAFAEAGLTVTSGLARGIDTAAHQGTLEADGCTVAVIGCGFNHMYPKENVALMEQIAGQGAVISEFAFDMAPLKQNFPWRNRIISALSQATVVIEAGKKSGALITADYALAQHRQVFVVPSNIDTDTALGSNQLIQEGAMVALSPDDVLSQIKEDHQPPGAKKRKAVLLLSDEQAQVYPHITHQPVHVDELVRQSGLTVSSLMNVALSLELKRVIRQLPGQYYVRNEHV
jgi:DNA processing protein